MDIINLLYNISNCRKYMLSRKDNHTRISRLVQIQYLNELKNKQRSNKYWWLFNMNLLNGPNTTVNWIEISKYKISNQQINWNKYVNHVKK